MQQSIAYSFAAVAFLYCFEKSFAFAFMLPNTGKFYKFIQVFMLLFGFDLKVSSGVFLSVCHRCEDNAKVNTFQRFYLSSCYGNLHGSRWFNLLLIIFRFWSTFQCWSTMDGSLR